MSPAQVVKTSDHLPITYGKTVTEIMSEFGCRRRISRYVKENKKSREKAKPWHEEAGQGRDAQG